MPRDYMIRMLRFYLYVLLRAHQKLTLARRIAISHGAALIYAPFSAKTLQTDLGLDPFDYGGTPLQLIWDWYRDDYMSTRANPIVADAEEYATKQTPIQVGRLLRSVLNQKFAGEFKATTTRTPSGYQPPSEYEWI